MIELRIRSKVADAAEYIPAEFKNMRQKVEHGFDVFALLTETFIESCEFPDSYFHRSALEYAHPRIIFSVLDNAPFPKEEKSVEKGRTGGSLEARS